MEFPFEKVKPALFEIDRFFRKVGIKYGFFAGTAAYFYGSVRNLDDVDVLTTREGVDIYAKEFSLQPVKGTFSLYKACTRINGVDVEVVSDIVIKVGDAAYRFDFDEEMVGGLRTIDLEGHKISAVSPEDIIAFKSMTRREGDGKFDLTDIENILKSEKVDRKKVLSRLRKCGYPGDIPV